MTLYEVLNAGFAGAAAFTALINLVIYLRKRSGVHEILVVLLSFALFVFYSALVKASIVAEDLQLVMRLFKFRLLLIMLMTVIWLAYLHVFFKSTRKGYLIGSLILMLILFIVASAIPVNLLFNLGPSAGFSQGPIGGWIAYDHGYTIWRFLVDLSVLILTVGGTLIMMTSFNKETQPSILRLAAGMVILCLFAFFDHLVDFGIIRFNYLFPYGLFLLLLLSGIEYVNMSVMEKESSEDALSKQHYMQVFLDETRFLIVRLNRMGQVVYANPTLYRITGYSSEEVLGKDWFENFLPKDKSFDIQSIFLQIIDQHYSDVVQNPIVGRDGREIQVEWYNTVLRGKDGEVYGVISLGVDVTEKMNKIVHLEKSLEEALAIIQKFGEKNQ